MWPHAGTMGVSHVRWGRTRLRRRQGSRSSRRCRAAGRKFIRYAHMRRLRTATQSTIADARPQGDPTKLPTLTPCAPSTTYTPGNGDWPQQFIRGANQTAHSALKHPMTTCTRARRRPHPRLSHQLRALPGNVDLCSGEAEKDCNEHMCQRPPTTNAKTLAMV